MPAIQELLSGIDVLNVQGDLACHVRKVCIQADRVAPKDVFIALPGTRHDGHDFISRALAKGAAAIIHQNRIDQFENSAVFIRVSNTRQALATVASNYYHNAAKALEITGVTGTNGKTTVCYLIRSLLAQKSMTGMLGTIGYYTGDERLGYGLTTPAPLDLHRLFRKMCDRHATHCVMEVTSHALEQYRVEGLDFKYALFTNLTSEHLDYHGSMQDYLAAKLKLFTGLGTNSTAIINLDDPHADRFIKTTTAPRIVTFSLHQQKADVWAKSFHTDQQGIFIEISTPTGDMCVHSRLFGRHNAENILAAAAFGFANGFGPVEVAVGISAVKAIPGRFEPVECGQPFPVIVDFCHTPDALEKTLRAVHHLYGHNVITVFGCGGDRDQQKRPEMGRIASQMSKHVIITNDNPRFEDPEKIIRDIEKGIDSGIDYTVSPDRREAIVEALSLAGPEDVVLIAGKGHETWQEIKGVRYPFDDREVVREYFDT